VPSYWPRRNGQTQELQTVEKRKSKSQAQKI